MQSKDVIIVQVKDRCRLDDGYVHLLDVIVFDPMHYDLVFAAARVRERKQSPMRQTKAYTKRLLLTFLALTGMLLVACTTTNPAQIVSTTKASPDKQVLIMPLAGVSDIPTLDPALAFDIREMTSIDNVFTGLVELNRQLDIVPQLAPSYSVSSDGLVWTFILKPNLKFSDGTPLTSHDVVYSIDRALQPATKSVVGPLYLSLIKDSDKLGAGKIKTIIGDSLLTPDNSTVVIITNKRVSYFLDTLSFPCSYVVEKRLIDKYGIHFTDHLTDGGGDGPWKVGEYLHNKHIVFVPNPNYYGPRPQLTKLIYPFFGNGDSLYQAYQAGQVDLAGIPPPRYLQQRCFRITSFCKFPSCGSTITL